MKVNTSSAWFNFGMVALLSGGLYLAGTMGGLTAPVAVSAPAVVGATNQYAVSFREASPFDYAHALLPHSTLSGPYVSGNLSIFLINKKGANVPNEFVSLHDAIRQNLVTVSEGSTNELPIVNHSNATIFVHSGDIFKGGNQDRMSQYDAIIDPREFTQLAAFCVEHDRSHPRGQEPSDHFTASTMPGATNGLIGPMIAAARLSGDQTEVWSNVWEAQNRLEDSTGERVQDRRSKSSLELTLESPAMQQARRPYFDDLGHVCDATSGAVGYIAFVDGAYVAGDVYANHQLFKTMWPKMLANRATDAIMARRAPLPPTENTPTTLASHGATLTSVNSRTIQSSKKTNRLALIETMDRYSMKTIHATIARVNE